MPEFQHDGVRFHYADSGQGAPFVFQHGLGGDVEQPFGLFTPADGFRLLAFDCRAHGKTEPTGPEEKIRIASFADDLGQFLDKLDLDRAVIGGISMGAAVAVNFALRYPERVQGVVLARPAWLEGPNLENAERFLLIATLLREYGPQRGKQEFQQTEIYRRILDESSDVADSCCGQFNNPLAVERAVRLEQIPLDAPYQSLDDLRAIGARTLVLANRQDPVHPFEYGQQIAKTIPGAAFQEITSKSVDADRHRADVQRFLTAYLASASLSC